MNELMIDKRIFVQCKRKNNARSLLPQIKYPTNFNINGSNIIRRLNEEIITQNKEQPSLKQKQTQVAQPPLSNILVSKRITPCNPEDSPYQIRKKPQHPMIRKDSSNKLIVDDINANDEENNRKTSTSHSQSIRKRAIHRQVLITQEKPLKIIRNEEYSFVVGKGNNNEELVRQILLDRKVWKEVKWGQCTPNLKWVFSKEKHNYKKMWSFTQVRSINHFQNNEELAAKDNLIYNLQIYCETKKLQIFSLTPVTFSINFDDEYCEYNMKQFLAFFLKNDPRKTANSTRKNGFITYNFVNRFQPYMAWQNSDIKKKVNILSRPVNNSTYYSNSENPSYIWLLKPIGLNRGRGIQIFDSLEQLELILNQYLLLMNKKPIKQGKQKKEKEKQKDKQKQDEEIEHIDEMQAQSKFCTEKFKLNSFSFVIQKYVERPLLINNRKFDIRVWALVTQNSNVYYFKEGYIRTSTQTYSTDNIDNYFIHLTNNAIQKNSQNYGQFESGNQLSYKDLSKFIDECQVETIWERMKEITYMTFSSVKRKLNPNSRKNCFELFGLDFFVDQELKVWLIEVNQNPCLECSSPLLQKMIPRMMSDAFKLTIDQIFPQKKPYEKIYPVDGYSNTENMWTHLGQLVPNGEYSPKKQCSGLKFI